MFYCYLFTFLTTFRADQNIGDCFAVFVAMVKTRNNATIEKVYRMLKDIKIKWKVTCNRSLIISISTGL